MTRVLPIATVIAWLAAMLATAYVVVQPALGNGFTRGLDRALMAFGWQIVATGLAILLWRLGRGWPRGSLRRWASLIPILLALGLTLFGLGLVADRLLLGV